MVKRPTQTRPPAAPEMALLPRIFAVLAAALLVGSVALASLLPSDISLYGALHMMHPVSPDHLQQLVMGRFGRFVWNAVALPLLNRPVWLIPASLGLICVGGALSTLNPTAPRTKQRRS